MTSPRHPHPPHAGRPFGSSPRSVVVLAVAVLGAAACSDGSQPAAYDAPRGAQRIITGLGIEVTANGRRALLVEADSGFVQEGSSTVTLVGVRAEAFGESQVARMTLEADSGRFDEETRLFIAMGNVAARTRDGAVSLETTHLVFDPAADLLRSDSAVVVDERGRTERGSCFEGDRLLTSWTVCGGPP